MSNKIKTISTLLLPCLFLVGIFGGCEKKNEGMKELENEKVINDETKTEENTEDEIESIQDLVDGEYQFEEVDTSSWKTYRNEEMGFEVKIPNYLRLIEEKDNVNFHRDCSALKKDFIARMRCQVKGDFKVSIYPGSLDDFIDKYKDDCNDDGHCFTFVSVIDDYALDGTSGKKLKGNTAAGVGAPNYVFAKKNGKNYLISHGDSQDEYVEMLSSFKFLNQNIY